MRVHFIINPRAGRGLSRGLLDAIREEFCDHDIALATDYRELPSAPPPDTVVAVGGDGTVNLAIRACARTQAILGILPRGSSNDLARALGIPTRLTAACAVIRDGHVARIDLLRVNGTRFATCGGLGLGAAVAIRANRWRRSGGRARPSWAALGRRIYPLAAMAELAHEVQPFHARLESGRNTRETLCAALLVSNQPKCGGFCTSPSASHRDGLLDLCEIVASANRRRLAWISWQALRGHLDRCQEVTHHRATALRITTDRFLPFFGDGEILCRAHRFDVSVQGRALRIAVPRSETAPTAAGSMRGVRCD